MREAKDFLEARVLRAVSVCGICGGSCVSLAGVVEGGGVPGRGRVNGWMILARRGEDRSCSWVSILVSVSIVLVVMFSSAAARLLLMSLLAWCIIVSVDGFVEILRESATVTYESIVLSLPFGESDRSLGSGEPMGDVSGLAKGEMTLNAAS